MRVRERTPIVDTRPDAEVDAGDPAPTTGRRNLLRGAAGLLVGAVAVDQLAGAGAAPTLPSRGGRIALRLEATDVTGTVAGAPTGTAPAYGDLLVVSGRLRLDDTEVGEVHVRTTHLGGTGRVTRWRTAGLTHHVLHLEDGAIVADGPTTHGADADVLPVVGGTGAYTGASGTVTVDLRPAGLGGDGTARYDLDIDITEAHDGR